MKTRIVMWGTNEKDEKVLIAIALRAEENVVDIYTFPFESTSEEFYNLMLNEWRESHEVPLPEGHTHIVKPLTASDNILPDDLKADRPDIIQRAQTEWHFVVLSNKLYQSFFNELEEIKEKIKGTDFYKNQLWEEMKEAWEKIQKNIFDKTLMREHGQQLRDMTNDIFTQLKNMRKEMDTEVDRVSREFAEKFNKTLDAVEEKIKSGLGLQPLFNDLKKLQQEFKDAQLSRNDRSRIWKRIDVAFKAVKEKKFGEKSAKDTSVLDRLNRRYEGLLSAIDKMEKSIRRDDKDKSFQDDRIANTEGQLEAQIRMAKLKMIDERINSKREKLAEMGKTKAELVERINREKKFLEEHRKQQAMKEELKEAKENVKQKIADTIHAQADTLDPDVLGKAAEAIAEEKARKSKPKKESMLGAIGETLGESLEDVNDSLGAIASVVADKIEETFRDLKSDTQNVIQDAKDDVKDTIDKIKQKMENKNETGNQEETTSSGQKEGSAASNLADKLENAFQDFKEEAEEIFNEVKEGIKDKIDDVKQKFKKEEGTGADSFTGTEAKEESVLSKIVDRAEDVFQDVKEEAGHIMQDVKEEAEKIFKNVKDEVKEKVEDLKEKLKKKEDTSGDDENATPQT